MRAKHTFLHAYFFHLHTTIHSGSLHMSANLVLAVSEDEL